MSTYTVGIHDIPDDLLRRLQDEHDDGWRAMCLMWFCAQHGLSPTFLALELEARRRGITHEHRGRVRRKRTRA